MEKPCLRKRKRTACGRLETWLGQQSACLAHRNGCGATPGGGGRKVRSSRSFVATDGVQVRLSYLRPSLKTTKPKTLVEGIVHGPTMAQRELSLV